MQGTGILAIWHDCAPGTEALYDGWYHGEHMVERLSVPGFLTGRRFVAFDGAPRFMISYETKSPEVLASAPYLARVNDPTPLTRQVMTEAFRNMIRTVCRRVECRGAPRGAYRVAARLGAGPAPAAPDDAGEGLLRLERWERAEPAGAPVSREEDLRGSDAKIAHCLVAETASEAAARALLVAWRQRFGTAAEVGGYRLTSFLGRGDLE